VFILVSSTSSLELFTCLKQAKALISSHSCDIRIPSFYAETNTQLTKGLKNLDIAALSGHRNQIV
jgi:serine protease inhibitor